MLITEIETEKQNRTTTQISNEMALFLKHVCCEKNNVVEIIRLVFHSILLFVFVAP